MTEILKETEEPDRAQKVPLLVKVGAVDERTVDLEVGRHVTMVLDAFAAERGCAVEELVLVREGEDAPLTEFVLVEANYPHRRRHHVHHTSSVKVEVFYQAGRHEREFKRYTTVESVLTWAIKAFNIDPSMATEFELALHGQTAELPAGEHIGHLAGRACDLALDLIRGHISNG